MPAMLGKAKTQQRLIDNLEDEFGKVVFPRSPVYVQALLYILTLKLLYRFRGSSIYLQGISRMLTTSGTS
ncbi:hypothetical protein Pyn_05942 [Prunus yedoensis var. nudiflora]|uniref:Uncharacterized protein n=1 Tax=Prunus yedoensis var. nudiflora TaxID=2094558 RepID=A0A314XRR2_PRUYE|nr:hypothetical protein Pyn_05942 [Prunus yedoensis var. nudiflora]